MPFVSEEELADEFSVFGFEFDSPQIIEKCNSTYKILRSKCQMSNEEETLPLFVNFCRDLYLYVMLRHMIPAGL